MEVLVTGSDGKVGKASVAALMEAGHEVRAVDLFPPVFERPEPGEPDYVHAAALPNH
ncbi:hypothetical protein BH23ACT11_BH23ACT11_27140 [soil metagenome]